MADHLRAAAMRNPFPGLRPFRPDEEHLFFGREHQIDRMIDKLAAHRFLAVVGTSGSGKSSLINCGLRPALHRGYMANAGAAWRMAQFRPGSDPIGQLARALAAPGVLFDEPMTGALSAEALVEATLRLGSLGLVDMVERADLPSCTRLLVVVDQFEELFRFRALVRGTSKDRFGPAEDATAFVKLLLEATARPGTSIHVVLTMRSDFLGDCAQFEGLPEAINESEYLVPRLRRDDIRSAITGPVAVASGDISPVLVSRLLSDVGDNPDQLSILQHALHRTWAGWEEDPARGSLDLPHYEASGGMARALDRHAEEAYRELRAAGRQHICERVFKALTDKGTDPRGIRRPTRLSTLADITGAPVQDVQAVIDVFREPSRSFLMPPLAETLTADSVIDISHESLMRVWQRLNRWADEEVQSMRTYRRISETVALFDSGEANLLRDPELRQALDWRRRNQPTSAWADQGGGDFDRAMAFLDDSRNEADIERRWLARWRYVPMAIVAGLFIFVYPYAEFYEGPFNIIPRLVRVISGETAAAYRESQLRAMTWPPVLLAGIPALVVYLVLAPWAKQRYRRIALADLQRQVRTGTAQGEMADPAPDLPAVEAHSTVYASFARRAAAGLADWAICLVAAGVAFFALFAVLIESNEGAILPATLLAWMLIFFLYHVLSWVSKRQATPGMRLAGIFVTDLRGGRLGWRRAAGRHFARFLSYYTLGFGFVLQAWDDRRQTLHDRLSGTVVLRRHRPL